MLPFFPRESYTAIFWGHKGKRTKPEMSSEELKREHPLFSKAEKAPH